MEIKAKRGDLLATLYWTQSIVERRNTMPILANVLIESAEKKTFALPQRIWKSGLEESRRGRYKRGHRYGQCEKTLRDYSRGAERTSPT